MAWSSLSADWIDRTLAILSPFNTLLRRGFGVALHLGALSAIAISALWVGSRFDLLHSLDGTHLGYTLLACAGVAFDSIPRANPVFLSLVGLRLVDRHGHWLPRPIRVARSLLLSLFLVLPTTFRIHELPTALPLSLREQLIAGGACLLAIILLPGLTSALTLGQQGVHDWICAARVLPKERYDLSSAASFQLRPLPLIGSLSLIWSAALFIALLSDWRSQASNRMMASLSAYFPKLMTTFAARTEQHTPPFTFITYQLRDAYYYDPDTDVLLEGTTDYYRVQVAPVILTQHSTRFKAALESTRRVLPLLPPGTRYISVDLLASEAFGPFFLSKGYRFLFDLDQGKFRYAPIGQHSERIVGSTPDSVTVITDYAPKLRRELDIAVNWGLMTQWRFPSLYFLADPIPTRAKLIG